MEAAACRIYCCVIIDALSSCRGTGPRSQPWGFVFLGGMWSSQLSCTACDWKSCGGFVESLQMTAWPQISLFSSVQWGHFTAFCGQVDGVSLIPARSLRESGDNIISTCFRTSVRFLFSGIATFQLENYLEELERTRHFNLLLCKMGQTTGRGKTWLGASSGPQGAALSP